MGFDHTSLNEAQRTRIYHYYLPVFLWCKRKLEQHQQSGAAGAMVLGISAPQGCGKSTLVEQLEALFLWCEVPAAAVSIDDFYLSFAQQSELSAAHPDNPLLKLRGNAGTHDLAMGSATLQALKGLVDESQSAKIPRYDKSAHGGRGDQAPSGSWPVLKGPLQILFFEGWMSGFSPLPEAEVAAVDPALVPVNRQLAGYKEAWDQWVDNWLVVRIEDPQWVFKWRLQAEEAMIKKGKAGMSEDGIRDFVARFIPAYTAYLPGLYKNGPTTATAGNTLTIEVDVNRSPVSGQSHQEQ
ncbi:MAG: hypothetical protein WDW38_009971 [Sanguina aurantia]